MLIECTIKRKNGTKADIDGKEYHFKPVSKTDDRHVCDVTDKKHIQRFLSITEAYELADDDAPVPASVEDKHLVSENTDAEPDLVVGKGAGGRWFVKQGKRPVSQGFESEDEAKAELDRLMAGGE